jgi:hypothetical protein
LLLPTGQYFKDAGTVNGQTLVRPVLKFRWCSIGWSGGFLLPGVQSAALSDTPPLSGSWYGTAFTLDTGSKPDAAGELPSAAFHMVSTDFFRTLNVPVLQGRAFDSRDSATSPWVVIVNQSMARKYWPDSNPIGRYLTFVRPGEGSAPVIGIATCVTGAECEEELRYVRASGQIPLSVNSHFYVRKSIILRATVDP